MKELKLSFLVFISMLICSCGEDSINTDDFRIEGLTLENYPTVDCSTSAAPLQTLIACKLTQQPYQWMPMLHWDGTYRIYPDYSSMTTDEIDNFSLFFNNKIKSSGTHDAFMNLIDKEVDFIITARTASEDELKYANQQSVQLIETPVALDAFIFILNNDNPVKELTNAQIKNIYKGEITYWSQVGGNNEMIIPYIRNANSGSQELMESLVLPRSEMKDWEETAESGMMGPFTSLPGSPGGICYTVYYYKEQMVRGNIVKHISVDGVYPNEKTIGNRTYPYTTEVYAVIRKDINKSSLAHQIYQLLQTDVGKKVIRESGYIPY